MTSTEKIPVILFIKSQQLYEDMDPDGTELMTEGILEVTEDGLRIAYDETELTGMEGTTTTFLVSPKRVILRRSGTTNSQMVFEEGVQHTSLYGTPFGELSMDIRTSRLRHNLTARCGIMEICYSIAVEHSLTGRNQFKIRVKPKMQ